MATAETYKSALLSTGFQNVQIQDRNAWYRATARQEREALAGPLYDNLTSAIGQEKLDQEIKVWDLMIVVLDSGELRPTHLRAVRPA